MALFGWLLAHARTLSPRRLWLYTLQINLNARAFYEKNGYRLVSTGEKNRLLKKYWKISARQIEKSVVLSREI